MLQLTKGQTDEKIVVTLNELKTLDDPFYLFVFTHVTTKEVVSFVVGEDESEYPERYNQFDINTEALFEESTYGEWHYEVYEQNSDTNTDTSLTTGLVEIGKMRLFSEDEFEYTKYNEAVTYKSYNG